MRFLVLLTLACLGCLPVMGASRVAVLAVGNELRPAGDILTASLSKADGVALVERAELDRIIREQSISLANASEAGKLLGADALLFLEASGPASNRNATLRLVGAKQGVILYSTRLRWPPDDLLAWSEKLSPKIAQAVLKAAVPSENATKLSVLNLRSAANSASEQLLERELTALLLSRLAQEPQLFVLERRQLEAAVFEKEIAASEEKFWTGSHLLDGTINRDGFDARRVTISARLRSPDGNVTPLEIEGPRDQMGKVIDDLTVKILAALKIQKRAVWDPAREAAQHLDEAKWALRWRMWSEAQAAADSAWALGEKSIDSATTRLLAYARVPAPQPRSWTLDQDRDLRIPSDPPPPDSVEAPFRSLAQVQETLAANPTALTNAAWWGAAREALDKAGEVLGKFYWAAEARQPVEEKLSQIRSLSRSVIDALLKQPVIRDAYWFPATNQIPSPDALEDYFRNGKDFFSIVARRAPMFYEKPEDSIAVERLLVSGDPFPYIRGELLDRHDDMPLVGGWKWQDRKRGPSAWESFVNELLASTNKLAQLEGHLFAFTLIPPKGLMRDIQFETALGPKTNQYRARLVAFIQENKAALIEGKAPRKIGEAAMDIEELRGNAFQEFWKLEEEFRNAAWDRRRASEDAVKIAAARQFFSEKRPYDFGVVAPLTHLNYTGPQAIEMLALLKTYRAEVVEKMGGGEGLGARSFLGLFERQLNDRAGITNPPLATVSTTTIQSSNGVTVSTNRVASAFPQMPPGMSNRMIRRPGLPVGIMGGYADPFRRTNNNVETILSPTTLKVDRFWTLPGLEPPPRARRGVGFSRPLEREGKLLMRIYRQGDPDPTTFQQPWESFLVVVDPASWRVEQKVDLKETEFEINLPHLGFDFNPRLPRNFEMLGGALLVLGQNGLQRKETNGAWQTFPLPATAGDLWRVRTNLYLLTADSLFQIDPNEGTAKTLVSVRRRPASVPPDELPTLAEAGLTEGPAGTLRLLAGTNSFLFNDVSWQTEAPISEAKWQASENGAFAIKRNLWKPTELSSLPPWDSQARLITRVFSPRPGLSAPLTVTNWSLAQHTVLGGKPFLYGTNVAILSGRGAAFSEGVRFGDKSSEMDLFIFGHVGDQPVQVPLELDLTKGPSPGAKDGFQHFEPWVVATETDLLVGHVSARGFWIIPRARIDEAIRSALSQKQTAEAKE